MAARTLGIIRRKSLSDVADGWDDCFITYRPASLGELKDLKALQTDGMTDEQGVDFMLAFIKDHIVGGKIRILGNDPAGPMALVTLELDDVDSLPQDVLMALMSDISGAKLDPKDTPTVPKTETVPSSDVAPTAIS